jgi:gliding motility-associated protein GldM
LKGRILSSSWEAALFENIPVAAAVTLLTKMQNDIRFVEGETLSTLLTNVDIGDYRVNLINAFVIPRSQIVTSGMPFEAQIVLAAIDSTKQPEYYLGETLLGSNMFSVNTSRVGDHSVSGKVIADGATYPFTTNYTVTETTATIAPTRMKFLYERIENDVEVAMSGIPSGNIRASLSGQGNIAFKEGITWTVSDLNINASPTVSVILTANVEGRTITESREFTVRRLPDPLPFLTYQDADGRPRKFVGGNISKRNLLSVQGVEAAIDDNVIYEPYTVTGFTITSIDRRGMSIPERSTSSDFTQRQREIIRDMPTGSNFFISNVIALDRTGSPITISYSIDVRITN